MRVYDKTKLSEDHAFQKYLLVLAVPLGASWTATVHTQRHMAVSETSMIKRQFQTETVKTQCLLGPANTFICKMQYAANKHDFYSCLWGECLFWETKSHLQSLWFWQVKATPQTGVQNTSFAAYTTRNGSPLPQGVTSLTKFNRIQNVAREDAGRDQLPLNRGYYLG